jgi:membrane fusion protein, multidrug efflux system
MHRPQQAREDFNPSINSYRRLLLALLRRCKLAIALSSLVGVSATCAGELATQTSQQLSVRGIMRASAQASISTDLVARVARVGFKEGERFRAGDVLIAFDCRRQQAELASAEAQHREMMIAFESAAFLQKRNAGSRQDVETTRAKADKAAADAEATRARLDQCAIIAPYDGHIVELSIHEYEMPVPGKPIFSIVAEGEPEVELIVPSTWLTWLTPSVEFQFQVDETGKSYSGVVIRLGASVDTVSQTIKVYARFKLTTPDILPGMSGTALFRQQEG